MSGITTAIELAGSQAALAGVLGVKQPTVSEWAQGRRPVPPKQCVRMERHFEGKVTCESLNPDAGWQRAGAVAKPWPYHPLGQPLVDVEASTQG